MKTSGSLPRFVMVACGLFLLACMLPGMIPLNRQPSAPLPAMEKDADKVIEVLNGTDYVRMEALAEEQYTEDLTKPGTRTYTIKITDDKPTYFGYGWCTTTEEILKQNFEHIKIALYFNDKVLGNDVVHPFSITRSDGLVCVDFGVLMSDWQNGEYKLKAVATFDDKINDGIADYPAGDYVFDYKVTVEKGGAASVTPSPT